MNVVGGFLITDRMLGMFQRDPGSGKREADAGAAAGTSSNDGPRSA
jgi:hypothetical protein